MSSVRAEVRRQLAPKWRWALSLALTSAVAAVHVRAAQGNPPSSVSPTAAVRLEIASQPLPAALTALATQTGVQLVFHPEDISASVISPALSGSYTPDEALTRILGNSGLSFYHVNPNTIAIRIARADKSARTNPRSASAAGDTGSDVAAGVGGNDSPHSASDPTSQSYVLEEVVVTAQKRQERLIDVPISMVALTSDELRQREVTNIDDLALIVPGISIESSGWQRRINLRGVGNTFGTWPTIGMYLDEADVTTSLVSQLSLNTYDLDRVEVLRGPQGTLYGEGSAGGTIRFITRDPNLEHFQFNSDYAALFTPDGAPGQRIEAVANMPLIEDTLGLRVSGIFDHEGGWIDQPAADRENINSQNLADVRVKGLWKPDAQLSVSAMAEVHRNDASTNQGEDPNGNYTQVFGLTTTPAVKDYFNIYNLTVGYDLETVRFLNTTSYVHQDLKTTDFGYTLQFTPPGTAPYGVDQNPYEPINSALTEEFRFMSPGTGPWQWTAGAIYRHVILRIHQAYAFGLLPLPEDTPLPAAFPNDTSTRSQSWAGFGDTSYRFADRLTLGVGLRYFHDGEDYTAASGGAPATYQTDTFHSLNPRAYAQYKLTDNANVYASAGKGFRSGGFNSVGQPTYGPESVRTYELGTKLAVLDGRLRIDTDIFFSQYTNYQVVGLTPAVPVNITSNAGDAQIKGVEWDVLWSPIDQWTLGLNGDYLHTRFTSIDATGTSYAVGDNLDLVPKYTVTASLQRDFKWGGHAGSTRLDYNQQGRETFRNRSLGPYYLSQSAVINMLNFNTSLDVSEMLRIGFFAQNLLNDRGVTSPVDFGNYGPRSRPRTFGVEFGVKFD